MSLEHLHPRRTRVLTAVLPAETDTDNILSTRARRALASLERAIDTFGEAERAYSPDDRGAYHRAALTIHLLNLALLECEQAGLPEEEIASRLRPVRRVYARSTFCQRLQHWPRGYPGDWETIDYLLDGENRTPVSDFAHHLERYALWCAASQQHRNKVAFQAALCARVMTAQPAAKILSIACIVSSIVCAEKVTDPLCSSVSSVAVIRTADGVTRLPSPSCRPCSVPKMRPKISLPMAERASATPSFDRSSAEPTSSGASRCPASRMTLWSGASSRPAS